MLRRGATDGNPDEYTTTNQHSDSTDQYATADGDPVEHVHADTHADVHSDRYPHVDTDSLPDKPAVAYADGDPNGRPRGPWDSDCRRRHLSPFRQFSRGRSRFTGLLPHAAWSRLPRRG